MPDAAPAARICFSFARDGGLKYISHLDLGRLFQRALRRALIPVDYSRGFNPHARLSLAVPLPVGVTAAAEYADLYLREAISPAAFLERLQEQLPAGLAVIGAGTADPGTPSLAARINAAVYRASPEPPVGSAGAGPGRAAWEAAAHALLSREAIMVERRGQKDIRTVDIRPFIHHLAVSFPAEDGSPPPFPKGGLGGITPAPPFPKGGSGGITPLVEMLLQVGSTGGAPPFPVLDELAAAAGCPGGPLLWRVHRAGLYILEGDGRLMPPPQAGGVSFWTKKLS